MDSISTILKSNGRTPEFDEHNKWLVKKMFKYAISDSKKGVLLLGDIGTGKSTLIRALNEFYKRTNQISKRFIETSAIKITSKYTEVGDDVFELLGNAYNYNYYIDDLGLESDASYFGNKLDVLKNAILIRYDIREKAKTFITTNLSINEIEQRYGKQVIDRLKEMCFFVKLEGTSRRV